MAKIKEAIMQGMPAKGMAECGRNKGGNHVWGMPANGMAECKINKEGLI